MGAQLAGAGEEPELLVQRKRPGEPVGEQLAGRTGAPTTYAPATADSRPASDSLSVSSAITGTVRRDVRGQSGQHAAGADLDQQVHGRRHLRHRGGEQDRLTHLA